MARTLHISYDEFGAKLGHVTFLVDDQIVCKLRNHERFDAEIRQEKTLRSSALNLGTAAPTAKISIKSLKNGSGETNLNQTNHSMQNIQ